MITDYSIPIGAMERIDIEFIVINNKNFKIEISLLFGFRISA